MSSLNSQDIELICQVLCDEITGSKITDMLTTLGLPVGDEGYTKWRRLSAILINACTNQGSLRPVFDSIEYVCVPSKYIDIPENWEMLKRNINKTLIFKGFELDDSGKVQKTARAQTFKDATLRLQTLEERLKDSDVHPLVSKYCSEELLQENYFHAILEASKGIFFRIREMTGSTLDSGKLVEECFKKNNPVIVINGNKLQSDEELSAYQGLKHLLLSIAQLYRNTNAHSLKLYNPNNLNDAITALTLMSLAHNLLDNCSNARRLD
ncbi:TIGR02391 family protein [Streptococcus ferus]|uniref:TIGR02391 family protein n=1 Tax=Streptococcus ferus TaxID=1345 RepID=UPI0035180BFC